MNQDEESAKIQESQRRYLASLVKCLDYPLADLNWSARPKKLVPFGVAGLLVRFSREDLLKLEGIGELSVKEVEEKMGYLGLRLG